MNTAKTKVKLILAHMDEWVIDTEVGFNQKWFARLSKLMAHQDIRFAVSSSRSYETLRDMLGDEQEALCYIADNGATVKAEGKTIATEKSGEKHAGEVSTAGLAEQQANALLELQQYYGIEPQACISLGQAGQTDDEVLQELAELLQDGSLLERMAKGEIYQEFEGSRQEANALEAQRIRCKELVYDYNLIRPSELEKRGEKLQEILGSCGEGVWMEAPVHFAYGSNVHIGSHFYANFNLVIVDDGPVYIGDSVMMAPNVTISATGHPVHPELRADGTQFSIPVHIGDRVWIGSNVVILPGVTIGENSVIGAGSVVTRDVPPNVVAVGNPCRVLREIGEQDRLYYYRDRRVNPPLGE